MNILITGPKHCGKSTVISKILKDFKGSASGFITEFDDRTSESRELKMRSIDGSLLRCAVKWVDGIPNVIHTVFDEFAPSLIDTNSELIIIDELGKFEKNSDTLKCAVENALDSPAHFLAAIRLDAQGWMQSLKERDDLVVITVDEFSRDALPAEIKAMLLTH